MKTKKPKMEMVKVEDLVSYSMNPKAHPQDQVDMIAQSIKDFGFRVPILITQDNEIVAGEGRRLAAIDLEISTVPCIRVDDLTPEQVRAFRIADNRAAESDWIEEFLSAELKTLEAAGYESSWMGFSLEDIDKRLEKKTGGGRGSGGDEAPEVSFSEELMEAHNYVVLYFDNKIDWLQAQTLLGLETVQSLDSRDGFKRQGIGRVLRGPEALNRIRERMGPAAGAEEGSQ